MSSLFEREMRDPKLARLFAQEELIGEATELIARTMNEIGLSRAALARKVEVTKPHITQVLGGERNMTLRTFADLMHAMGRKVLLASTSMSERDVSDTVCWVVKAPRHRLRFEWQETELLTGAAVEAA